MRALPRIAKAVEEARREIDGQTLQLLIDPEHRMDAAIGSDFGKIGASAAIPNRAMSGTEPSPMLQLLALRGGLVIERGLIGRGSTPEFAEYLLHKT